MTDDRLLDALEHGLLVAATARALRRLLVHLDDHPAAEAAARWAALVLDVTERRN